MSLYTESTDHIHSRNNSQIRHPLVQLILPSTKEIPVKENKKKNDEQKTICPSLYCHRDPSNEDKSKGAGQQQ
jgi:hypothetical protein